MMLVKTLISKKMSLIAKRMVRFLPLISSLSLIREKGKWVALLLRELSQNKGLRRQCPVKDEIWVKKCNTPYFQKVPLIAKRTILSLPLIPLLLVNMGIRENAKRAALLLRELSHNKGLRHQCPVKDKMWVEKSNHNRTECPVRDMICHEYCVPNGTPAFVGTSIFYPHVIPKGITYGTRRFMSTKETGQISHHALRRPVRDEMWVENGQIPHHALRSPVRDEMWVENGQISHHALRSPVRDEILVEKSKHNRTECPVRDMMCHEYCVPNGTPVFVGTSIFYPHQTNGTARCGLWICSFSTHIKSLTG